MKIARIGMLVMTLCFSSAAMAQSLTGLWEGKVSIDALSIPFQIEIASDGSDVKGAFLNGEQKVTSTAGHFEDGVLVLNFDEYAETLQATLKDHHLTGTIEGRFGPGPRKKLPFEAQPFVHAPASEAASVPSIDGVWEIENKSPKGELAWRLIVRQTGAEVSAAILRVDGDTGSLTGHYNDGEFKLSHFSGERPYLVDVTPQSDGTISLTVSDRTGARDLTGYRPAAARAKGLPEPTDPTQHTKVKDPSKPFEFSFRDVEGNLISNTDPRFRGKVVLVNITGSWCPNCHDEAPFLAELYRKYRGAGLEIVALDFEEAEQLEDLARLRAFIKHYGIEYTVLVGGLPDQVNEKIPQLVNLNAWPTTVFIGRDGLVNGINVGFASPASGEFNNQQKEEITASVQALLAENQHASR
ncbi:MAG: TlpA disulfide reductase family protein [Candidatus Acidiferrales bacterium]|jgi:thiol-disulfide isomerase/thioredoxin